MATLANPGWLGQETSRISFLRIQDSPSAPLWRVKVAAVSDATPDTLPIAEQKNGGKEESATPYKKEWPALKGRGA